MQSLQKKARFNIAAEPWIPVIYLDGNRGEVSIEDTFRDAGRIREIEGDQAQQVLPILRLLLAVLYRSQPMPDGDDESALMKEWAAIWKRGHFDLEAIREYLDTFHDRFDIFDEHHPFFQVAGLEYAGRGPDGISELVADVPKDEKFLFSMRDRNRLQSLSFAAASRCLIFQQSYATAGIKTPVKGYSGAKAGKAYAPTGGGTGMLGAEGGIYLEGKNLFETLMLNWVLFDDRRGGVPIVGCDEDVPPWEKDETTPDRRDPQPGEPYGPVQAYTWQSRRMRLIPNDEGTAVIGVVSCYGDTPCVVDVCGSEPMSAWKESSKQQKKKLPYVPLMPQTHDPSRQTWRGLASIVSYDGKDLRSGVVRWFERLCDGGFVSRDAMPTVAIHAQGMKYESPYNSFYVDSIDDRFDLSVSLLDHDSSECFQALGVIDKTDEAVNKLADCVLNIQRASGRSLKAKSSKAVSKTERMHVRELMYSELDGICRARLAGFPSGVDPAAEYCKAWKDDVHRKIRAAANRYVGSSDRSFFDEHDSMTVGRALANLSAELNKVLGVIGSGAAGQGEDNVGSPESATEAERM